MSFIVKVESSQGGKGILTTDYLDEAMEYVCRVLMIGGKVTMESNPPATPDLSRSHATVYERAAWHHDIGDHEDSKYPFQYCPRCEMEHPKGRLSQLQAQLHTVTDLANGLATGVAQFRSIAYLYDCDECQVPDKMIELCHQTYDDLLQKYRSLDLPTD